MSRSLSGNLLAAINGPETDEVLAALVTISHPDYPAGPLRISSHNTVRYDDEGPRYRTVSRGQNYEFLPFEITLPDDNEDGQPTVQITVDNVTRELTPLVASVSTPATVTVEFVMVSAPNVVEWSLPDFALVSAELDAGSVVLTLVVDALLDEAYPGYDFTPSAFGGLWSTT